MAKKKKKNRNKNLRRTPRLSRGKDWLKTYQGEGLIEDYIQRFGVDLLCAVVELRMLGVAISEDYEHQLRQNEEYQRRSKKKGGKQIEEDFLDGFSDENFAYIAGYTSGGVPFGLTHEEAGNIFED